MAVTVGQQSWSRPRSRKGSAGRSPRATAAAVFALGDRGPRCRRCDARGLDRNEPSRILSLIGDDRELRTGAADDMLGGFRVAVAASGSQGEVRPDELLPPQPEHQAVRVGGWRAPAVPPCPLRRVGAARCVLPGVRLTQASAASGRYGSWPGPKTSLRSAGGNGGCPNRGLELRADGRARGGAMWAQSPAGKRRSQRAQLPARRVKLQVLCVPLMPSCALIARFVLPW